MPVALIWNALMLSLPKTHSISHGACDNYFEPQSINSEMISEHRPLMNHKPEGFEMKLKCMLIFTTLIKSQQTNLFSDLLTSCGCMVEYQVFQARGAVSSKCAHQSAFGPLSQERLAIWKSSANFYHLQAENSVLPDTPPTPHLSKL